jgi:hypothetical protein
MIRRRFGLTLILMVFLMGAGPAWARIGPRWPAPLEDAPVSRAIANVAADTSLPPSQRERVIARLHLIGYAQSGVVMRRYATGEWTPDNEPPCSDPAYAAQRADATLGGFHCIGVAERRELPARLGEVDSEGRAHLRAARRHYERALELDGSNLRARLGLAYAFDELGQQWQARRQLRQIIQLALQRVDGAQGDPDDYRIILEAMDHLEHLARSAEDRTAIAEVRAKVNERDFIVVTATPIVIPLVDAPFDSLIENDSRVEFDFGGVGDRAAFGWLGGDAAWLVWDPRRAGVVRTGFDMIGQRTWGVFWTDGFEALRALDDDGDGQLSGPELGGLALWHDSDGDGVSDAGEIQPIERYGIVSLATRAIATRPDLLVAPDGVQFEGGARSPLYDWTPGRQNSGIS